MDHSIGYTPYSLVLNSTVQPPAAFGKPAVIAIRTDASYGSGHWYEGGGAYPILLVGYVTAPRARVMMLERAHYPMAVCARHHPASRVLPSFTWC